MTPEQDKIAQSEGWKIRAGFPERRFDFKGECPFSSGFDLVYFIRERGLTSEFHREVFDTLPWGPAHDAMAKKDGWCLAFDQIRSTDRTKFATEEIAQNYVLERAEQHDPLCQKALRTLAKRRLSNADRKSPWHQ